MIKLIWNVKKLFHKVVNKFKVLNNVKEFQKFHVFGMMMNANLNKKVYQIHVKILLIVMALKQLAFKLKNLDKCVLLLIINVNHFMKLKIIIIVSIILIKMLVWCKHNHNVFGIQMYFKKWMIIFNFVRLLINKTHNNVMRILVICHV